MNIIGIKPLAHAAAGEDARHPPLHFLRGAPGKGEQQNAARIGALLDEIGDPIASAQRMRRCGSRVFG
jgi:hypothetical protein